MRLKWDNLTASVSDPYLAKQEPPYHIMPRNTLSSFVRRLISVESDTTKPSANTEFQEERGSLRHYIWTIRHTLIPPTPPLSE